MSKFFRNNGLSLVLTSLFFIFWSSQALSGWYVHNDELRTTARPELMFSEYLHSGHFWQATGENWESEFLQMGCYVVLTIFLYQKGSAESKDPDDVQNEKADTNDQSVSWLYRNSLSLAFLVLFLLSFAIHASGGLSEENNKRLGQGRPPETMGDFLTSSQFWFESFQNWQSEFLAVLSIVTLTIFLRQKGSPESKSVCEPNSKTGS
ncbi:MAG: DUF6766 family protein [Verrucomicrobiota bacterium]